MATEIRALWVFGQSADKDEIHFITSRRFPSVETRLRVRLLEAGMEYTAIPMDQHVLDEFSACILREPLGEPVEIPNLSKSLQGEISERPFLWQPDDTSGASRGSWPFGPTMSLEFGKVWPFIFISSTNEYCRIPSSNRLWFCGVVALKSVNSSSASSLLSLPEVSAGYKLLRDLSKLFPSQSVKPSTAAIARFLYMLKMAMPFGAPVMTDLDVLESLHVADMSVVDTALITQPVNQSCHRVPLWKPVPTLGIVQGAAAPVVAAASTTTIVTVVEKLSFDISENACTCIVTGEITCESDIPGTPELIVPVSYRVIPSCVCGVDAPIISTDSCTKIVSMESIEDSERKVAKLSIIPRKGKFTAGSYHYPEFEVEEGFSTPFPITASFTLFQISQSRFKFRLDAKLNSLFSTFSVRFSVTSNSDVHAEQIQTVDISTRTRIDVSAEGAIVWTFKTPGTYSEFGEFAEGLIDIPQESAVNESDTIAQSAICQFTMFGKNYSSMEIDKKQVTVFPNNSKYQVTINYELLAMTGRCCIRNSSAEQTYTDKAEKAVTRTSTRAMSQLLIVT